MLTIPTNETILKTVSRSLPDRTFIVATVGLHYLSGNRESHWTATADIYEPRGTWSGEARWRNGRDSDGGGACHDDILRAFPHLAPIVAVHSSSPEGVPMYAIENGRHHLRQGNRDAAARLWRTTIDYLPDITDVETYVDAQRERWACEAERAYELLRSL